MRKLSLKFVIFPVLSAALGLLFLTSCGATGSTTTGIPTVTPPTGGGPTSPLPEEPPTTTPGLPDLSASVAINLRDKVTYSDLSAIAGNIVTPIVGDPRALLKITNTRNQSVNGTLLVAFEDKLGFWGADMKSVPGTGVNTSSSLDIIFSDDALTLRVQASRLGDNLLSTLYYRKRATGETQCLPVKCYITFGGVRYEVPFGSAWCPMAAPDVAGTCQAYMNPISSNTAVKQLGTFSVKYTDIAVLPEGN